MEFVFAGCVLFLGAAFVLFLSLIEMSGSMSRGGH